MATFETKSTSFEPVTKVPSNGNGQRRTGEAPPNGAAEAKMVPSRMVRFGIVGCIGIVVNLLVLAVISLILHFVRGARTA